MQARRRILAPAHRAASGPTTTAPFPPAGRSLSSAGMLDARRASMPTDSLQLYHPLSLQSLPAGHSHHSGDYPGSTRHLLGLPSRGSHLNGPGGIDYGHHQGRLSLPYGQGSHNPAPSSHHYLSSHLAPSGNHLYGSGSHHGSNGLAPIQQGQAQQNSYPSSYAPSHRASIHGHETQSSTQAGNSFFTSEGQSSAAGSGYPGPQ